MVLRGKNGKDPFGVYSKGPKPNKHFQHSLFIQK